MLPYHLRIPSRILYPIIATVPASGSCIPTNIEQRFKQPPPLLTNVGWPLDKLYDFLPDLGITVLQATQSRYVVDVNRALKAPLSGSAKSSVICEADVFGNPLYEVPLTLTEINERIEKYYHPFHDRLTHLLEETIHRAGKAYLIDLHSFFSETTWDICLGNQRNRTSSRAFRDMVAAAFQQNSFTITKNTGLTGSYITQHYGNKDSVESLQIGLRSPVDAKQEGWNEVMTRECDAAHFQETRARLYRVFACIVASIDELN